MHLKRRHVQEGSRQDLSALLTSHPASSEVLKAVPPSLLLSPKKQDNISHHFPNHGANSYSTGCRGVPPLPTEVQPFACFTEGV